MITKSTMDEVDVLIIGAGPAGLMMAAWMSACGIKTRIVDKRGTKVSCEPSQDNQVWWLFLFVSIFDGRFL